MVTKPSDGGLEVHPGNQAIPGRPEGWKGFQMAVQDLVARLRAQAPEPAPVPVPDPEPEEPLRGDQKMPEAWKVADFLEEHARMWQAVAGIISGYADDLEASEMFPKTIAANLALQELHSNDNDNLSK